MLLRTSVKQNHTLRQLKQKKNLPGTVFKNIACKKKKNGEKNRNDVKRKLK